MKRIALACIGYIACAGCLALLPLSSVHAQTTGTVSSLFLSNGSELDFNLYGANGGSSDKLSVQNQFNFSSASPGSYIVGFSLGDTTPLTPGGTFTLIEFGSTNFTPADAARFTAAPRSGLNSITGNFTLSAPNTTNGTPGTLRFQLTSSTAMPEPGSLCLILLTAPLLGVARFHWRTRASL